MNSQTDSPQIAIIGGGAIGMSIAWELAQRECRVTVFDQGRFGRGTSWAAAGILPPANWETATDPNDQIRGLSHKMFPSWIERLESLTDVDCGFRQCGGWYLADTVGEKAAMIGTTEYWRDLEIKCSRVEASEVASREPTLSKWCKRSNNIAAWWAPGECQIRCPDYVRALEVACQRCDVELVPHTCVREIENLPNGVSLELMGPSNQLATKRYDIVIACAGVWTGQIASMLRLEKSLIPIRGQILLFKTAQPILKSVVNVGHRYIIARDDGHTLVGSCEEEAGFELGTTEETLANLRRFAFDVCPQLETSAEVKAWSGLRPLTFDEFPMLGRVPTTSHLYVAAGHYRSGIHFSPATAVLMADEILGGSPAIDLYPFRVGKQQSSCESDPGAGTHSSINETI